MAAASSSSSLDPKTLNPSSTNPPPTSSSQSPQPFFPSLLSTPKPPTSSSSTPSPQIPKTQDPMGGYPLASSGRGFVPPKSFRPDQLVTVANSGAGFPPRSTAPPQFSNQVRSFGFPNQTPSSMRPPFSSVFKPRPPMGSSATASGPMKSNSPAVLHANNKMNFEDDKHYESDADTLHAFYGGETDVDSDDDDEGDSPFLGNDSDYDEYYDTDDPTSIRERNYTVLSEDDIWQRQEKDIREVSTVLSLSRFSACVLLYHYNWSVSGVHEAWFADEEKVRNVVGLLEKPVVHYRNDKEVRCPICFEYYCHQRMYAASCGHPFCSACWKGYVDTSINDGPGCLTLRCPDSECRAAVGLDIIYILASDEGKEKYSHYLHRSYVETSRKTKWCPAPGCDYAIDFVVGSGSYDVSCNCTYSFCWNCTYEAHRPVDCDTVAKWMLKTRAEGNNMDWILANSKPCPKCQRPIQKNQGCMHMTCTPPCNFQFCWMCLDPWSIHGVVTGGFYACNRYETAKRDGAYAETEKRREMAKNALDRYIHYYERWTNNESSRNYAKGELKRMQAMHMKKLIDKQGQFESQLKFITEAWLQIIDCRRVLKWTYAYGYYLPENETNKRQFFEYLQGEAESGLERLHQCAEKDLQVYIDAEDQSEDFKNFRIKLNDLTRVTCNYFENLVRALENGLADVKTHGASSQRRSLKSSRGSNNEKGGRGKGRTSKPWFCENCKHYHRKSATICKMCNTHL